MCTHACTGTYDAPHTRRTTGTRALAANKTKSRQTVKMDKNGLNKLCGHAGTTCCANARHLRQHDGAHSTTTPLGAALQPPRSAQHTAARTAAPNILIRLQQLKKHQQEESKSTIIRNSTQSTHKPRTHRPTSPCCPLSQCPRPFFPAPTCP